MQRKSRNRFFRSGSRNNLKSKIQNLKWAGFLAILVLLVGCVGMADAQQPAKIPRIGILPPGPISAERMHLWEAFRQGLRELGYVEGQNIALQFPSGEVKTERLPELAAELVRSDVNIIVAVAQPAVRAAQRATRSIPIVTPVVSDPVETGIVTSLAHPGGNVTGLSLLSVDLSGKRLELAKEIIPKISRIAILSNAVNPGNITPQLRGVKTAASALGLSIQVVEVLGANDFERAFQDAKKGRAGALLVLDDSLFFTHLTQIVRLAEQNRLPAIYGFTEFVEAGGLMVYAANLAGMFRRAATYVDKILKGAKPADLPVEQPTKFEFIINLKTAKQIGLTIPPNVLTRADKVIK